MPRRMPRGCREAPRCAAAWARAACVGSGSVPDGARALARPPATPGAGGSVRASRSYCRSAYGMADPPAAVECPDAPRRAASAVVVAPRLPTRPLPVRWRPSRTARKTCDGKPADETITFALDGREYEIDLTAKN